MYVGTAAGFGVLHPVFAQGFMTGLGSRSMYSSSTQDCANKFAVAREVYGFPFTQPFPDLERIRCLVIVGANPVISKWSFLQVPNPARALQAIEARGGRVFVVDPRRTETARAAGEHVFIRPDTDVFFYLSFLRELLAGGVDEARVGALRPGPRGGAGALRALDARSAPPRSRASRRRSCGRWWRPSGPPTGRRSTPRPASTWGRTGRWPSGCRRWRTASPGNLDRPGGTLVGNGVIDFAAFGKKTGTLMRNRPVAHRRFPVGERRLPRAGSWPTRS